MAFFLSRTESYLRLAEWAFKPVTKLFKRFSGERRHLDHVVLICVHDGSGGTLPSVKNDLRLWLEVLKYDPADTTTYYRILADFEFEYKGVKLPVQHPTRKNIEQAIKDASQGRTSGLISFAGHGGHDDNNSYILARDPDLQDCDEIRGTKIFGSDFVNWLPLERGTETRVFLDACSSSGFFPDFLFVYDGVNIPASKVSAGSKTTGQLILVAAARVGQEANPVALEPPPDPEQRYGALLYIFSQYYGELKGKPMLPQGLIKLANAQIKAYGFNEQQFQISSKFPIRGPFLFP